MNYVGLTGKLSLEQGGHISLIVIFLTTDSGRSPLSGTAVADADGLYIIDPPELGTLGVFTGLFTVSSGPCAASDGGRCVGRAGGYGPSEACAITVGGGGGVLGACGVFDIFGYSAADILTMPDGSTHGGSDCPAGAALLPGDSVGWASDGYWQGSNSGTANGCAAKASCGLPWSQSGLGGGWQICFA